MLSIVVAVSENNVIGKNNTLPWHLPGDLKKFKEITLSKSKTMIMGRKTFEALPEVLPGRKHIILTRNKDYKVNNKNVEVLNDLDRIKYFIESKEEYFLIGGGEIFKLLIPFVKKIYLTIIHEAFEGDTFFPYHKESQWKVTEKEIGTLDEKNIHRHTFLILERI